jgi:hypothetical protein
LARAAVPIAEAVTIGIVTRPSVRTVNAPFDIMCLHIPVPQGLETLYEHPFAREFLENHLDDEERLHRAIAADLLTLKLPILPDRPVGNVSPAIEISGCQMDPGQVRKPPIFLGKAVRLPDRPFGNVSPLRPPNVVDQAGHALAGGPSHLAGSRVGAPCAAGVERGQASRSWKRS